MLVDLFAIELAADVTCVKAGEKALEQIHTGVFGLAIIDIGMPQISGFELATHAVTNNVPVSLYSGHPGALRKLQEHDFAYLEKPLAIEELVNRERHPTVSLRRNVLLKVAASHSRRSCYQRFRERSFSSLDVSVSSFFF